MTAAARRLTLVLLAVAALAVTAAASPTAAAAAAPTTTLATPLAVGGAVPGASWAVVAMGRLHQPLNTFWQVFVRRSTSSSWALATPVGVADNGGLVASTAGATTVTVGFEPSQFLRFSPLATSSDLGRRWQPGLVPAALADVPDALTPGPRSDLLALVRTAGGEVQSGLSTSAAWHTVGTRRGLARDTAGGRRCRPRSLDAMTSTIDGAVIVGAACSTTGTSGLFAEVAPATGWSSIGPAAASDVLRLARTGTTVTGLATDGRRHLTALWHSAATAAGPWSQSRPLLLPRHSTVVSSVVQGAVVVLLRSGRNHTLLAEVTGPGRSWRRLPSPPPGTSTLAPVPGGQLDAMAARGTRLTVFALDPGQTRWRDVQRLDVPISYGTSN